MAVFFFADGGLEADRLLCDLQNVTHLFHRHVHDLGNFFGAGVVAQLLQQLTRDTDGLVDRLNHVDRDADRACLVRNGAGDGLTDPPGRVGGKLVAFGVIKLLHSLDETEVAFLNQVEEQHPASDIALGDGHHKAQVRLGHTALRLFVALTHLSRQLDLFLRRQQRDLADLLQVHAHRIIGGKTVHQRVGIGNLLVGHLLHRTQVIQLGKQIVIQRRQQVAGAVIQFDPGLVQFLVKAINGFRLEIELVEQLQILCGELSGLLALLEKLLQPFLRRTVVRNLLLLFRAFSRSLDQLGLLLLGNIGTGSLLDELVRHAFQFFFGKLKFVVHEWYPFPLSRSRSLSALRSGAPDCSRRSFCSRILVV